MRLHLFGKRNHKEWDAGLPQTLFQMRTRKNAATGMSPAEVLMGRNLLRPGAWRFEESASTIDRAKRIADAKQQQNKYIKQYSVQVPDESKNPNTGDPILSKTHHLSNAAEYFHAGFAPKWEGPYTVVAQEGDVYTIDRGGEAVKYLGSEIKLVPNEMSPDNGQLKAENRPEAKTSINDETSMESTHEHNLRPRQKPREQN